VAKERCHGQAAMVLADHINSWWGVELLIPLLKHTKWYYFCELSRPMPTWGKVHTKFYMYYLFIGGTNTRYGENSQVLSSRWGEKSVTSSDAVVVSKYATLRESMKNYDGAQQITSLPNQNSNKSQLVTSRYSFPVCRKPRRNWLCVSILQNGAQLYFTPQNLE
jgi:hypothetical protein